ncbi:tetratricopeptide repeat protein [Microbacterium sp. HMH0099]|uniref:tetratricopeptide repeat protein n=1 Tax=Microbacterium sp. HMH0099 TaxID=3414026 RepID=UPI003BF6744B
MNETETIQRAVLYLEANRPREARTQLRPILIEHPTHARAHLLMALADRRLADAASAESHARAAMADPDARAVARGVLAEIIAEDEARLVEAKDLAAAAVEEQPEDANSLRILARLEARVGDVDTAWAHAEAAVRLAPDTSSRASALIDLARISLASRRRRGRTLAIMEEAARLAPTDADVMSMLAYAQLRARRRSDAIRTSLTILRSAPTERLPAFVARTAVHVIGSRLSDTLLAVAVLSLVIAGAFSSPGSPVGARVGGALGVTAVVTVVLLTSRSLLRAIDGRRLWRIVRTQPAGLLAILDVGAALVVSLSQLVGGVFLQPLSFLVYVLIASAYGRTRPRP